MSEPTYAADEEVPPPPSEPTAWTRRRGWWALAGTVLAVGFVVSVVSSARQEAAPSGATPAMPGMSMSGNADGGMRMTVRDVAGRLVRIPDGRAGVAVFVSMRGCGGCAQVVRTAAQTVKRWTGRADLTVISVDPATRRRELQSLAQSAGGSPAQLVVDDRNGALASMFGAAGTGDAVVYDATGRVIAHPPATTPQLLRALRRTST